MACFLVPAAEAVVTTVAAKLTEAKEKKNGADCPEKEAVQKELKTRIPFSTKLKWLSRLLTGGSVLLAFEHVWHGEITPWFPFLTAAKSAADAAEMFREMAVSGTAMAVLVTAAWGVTVAVAGMIEKKADGQKTEPVKE